MYLRKSIRTYKGKTYTNYVLVESIVTPNGPRQKTICWLGDLSPRPREEWLALVRKIEAALLGQDNLLAGDDDEIAEIIGSVGAQRTKDTRIQPESSAAPPRTRGPAPVKVDPSRVTTEQHREAGPVHVGYQFWQRLELDQILRDCGLSPVVRRLTCVMTLNRLIAPASEHAMPAWIRRTALDDILGVSFDALEEDPLYQVLDSLHPHRATIEAALIERERSLFNLDQTIYLCGFTSTYFEGLGVGNLKATRGHWCDHRSDCKQFVIGLALNRDGFPLAHEIFDGNTRDYGTLGTMIDCLCQRVELRQGATVVIDRGTAYGVNLADISARKLHYIIASRPPLDVGKHLTAEKLDGCYLLKTDRKDLTAGEIWRTHTLLSRAEDAFREMKSPPAISADFHHEEHRTTSRIFLCLLAYHLLSAIEKTLLDQGIHTSWASVRDTLKAHQVCTVVLPIDDDSRLRIRKAATPESDVQQIYRNLGIPARVITPKHTWASSANSD